MAWSGDRPSSTNVDRLGFDNWGEHQALYPDAKGIVEMPYARAQSVRQVPRAIRQRLAARAAVSAKRHPLGCRFQLVEAALRRAAAKRQSSGCRRLDLAKALRR